MEQPELNETMLNTLVNANVARGFITGIKDGEVFVEVDGSEFRCDILQSSSAPIAYIPGDEVLLIPTKKGPILVGRIQVCCPMADTPQPSEIPDEVLIEAKENLTLKCGSGSITLRSDGKVLIKGKDLVSKAQQANRIKGGSVSIN